MKCKFLSWIPFILILGLLFITPSLGHNKQGRIKTRYPDLCSPAPFTTATNPILKDFQHYDDPLLQFQEQYHMFNATSYSMNKKMANLQVDSIRCNWKILGRNYEVIFQDYVKRPGQLGVSHYTPLGVENYTPAQFKAIVTDLYNQIKRAEKANRKFLQEVKSQVYKTVADNLDITVSELKSKLDDVVMDNIKPAITVRELLGIPNFEGDKSDVLFIYGLIPKPLWGFSTTWIPGGSRIIFYHTQARLNDYILGYPATLRHELFHAAGQQYMPFQWYYDVELFTALAINVSENDPLNLMYDPYLQQLRQFLRVAFGFDIKEVNHQMIKLVLAGNVQLNRDKFRRYTDMINSVIRELQKTIRDVMIPLFYSDQLFWSTVNTEFCTDSAMFWAIMASVYDPANLEDPKYSIEELKAMSREERSRKRYAYTSRWVKEHWDLIKQASDEAWAKTGEKKDTEELYEFAPEGLKWCPLAGRNLPADVKAKLIKLLKNYGLRKTVLKFLIGEVS